MNPVVENVNVVNFLPCSSQLFISRYVSCESCVEFYSFHPVFHVSTQLLQFGNAADSGVGGSVFIIVIRHWLLWKLYEQTKGNC